MKEREKEDHGRADSIMMFDLICTNKFYLKGQNREHKGCKKFNNNIAVLQGIKIKGYYSCIVIFFSIFCVCVCCAAVQLILMIKSRLKNKVSFSSICGKQRIEGKFLVLHCLFMQIFGQISVCHFEISYYFKAMSKSSFYGFKAFVIGCKS